MSKTIQSPAGVEHARILGVGGYRPSRVITNEQICQVIDSTDEWIRTRTGIEERRWATAEETVGVMSVAAAGKALAAAGVEAEQLGCVIISTVTHLAQTPSLAADVANQLGAVNAAAFDISAACAGFCHGLALAQDMIRGGSAEYVALLAAADAGTPPASAITPGGPSLSARERELVTLVARGRTNAQIAAELFISVRTVGSHLDRIRDKTGCRRRADLTRLALETRLV